MTTRFAIALLLMAAPLWADTKKVDVNLDPAIKGKWEVVSGRFNGNDSPIVIGRVLKFSNGELTTYFDDDEKDLVVDITFDLKSMPKRIDIEQRLGGMAEGIYTIDKGVLKICYAEPGAERPTKFESAVGDRHFLLILKRVETDK